MFPFTFWFVNFCSYFTKFLLFSTCQTRFVVDNFVFSGFDAIRTYFTFKSVLVEDDVHGAVRCSGGNDVVVRGGRGHASYFAIQFGLFVRVNLPTQSLFQGVRDINAANGLKFMKICRYNPVLPYTVLKI